jgi:hypothetical protein
MGAVPDFCHALLSGMKAPKGKISKDGEQVARYLDLAREHGFDGLLTISNQIRSDPTDLPYSVHKAKLRGLTVYHASWWRVLTEAIVQHRFRGIEDPDQAWILDELIRYLDDEKSGASGFEGIGQEWVRVRESARNETLRPSDVEAKGLADGILACSIRVPDAAGPIGVEANLRTRRVTTTVEVAAPSEGRPRTRSTGFSGS